MRNQKISRREFLRAAVLTGGALALGACAQPTPGSTAKPEETKPTEAAKSTSPPTQGPVTISYWYYWSGLLGDTCAAVANEFMKTNPNIKVEATTTDAQWEKVLSAFAAGTPPDVLLDFTGSQLMPRNQLLPLDDMISTTTDIKQDNYFPAWWNAFSWKGKQYGLPAAEAGADMAMIINKGMATEAGLDLQNPPQTIDEMLSWAEKMTKPGKNGVLETIGFDPLDGTSGQGFYNWAAIYGKNWWDVNTQKFDWLSLTDAFTWQAEWINRWGAANFEAFRKGFGGWLEPDSSMAQGKQGIHINGYWTPGELTHKGAAGQEWVYNWVPVPDARKGVRVQTSLPTGIHLPTPNKSQDASFKLLAYICSDVSNQMYFDAAGTFCWTKSFLPKVDTTKYTGLDFYVKSISEAKELYSNVQNCPLGFQYPQDRYLEALNKVIYDKVAPEDALNEAQKSCEEELAKLLKG